jgi:hypothetical protein
MKSRQRHDPLHNQNRPIARGRRGRHSWPHANEAVCRDNARPVLGYADTEGVSDDGSDTAGRSSSTCLIDPITTCFPKSPT